MDLGIEQRSFFYLYLKLKIKLCFKVALYPNQYLAYIQQAKSFLAYFEIFYVKKRNIFKNGVDNSLIDINLLGEEDSPDTLLEEFSRTFLPTTNNPNKMSSPVVPRLNPGAVADTLLPHIQDLVSEKYTRY